VVSRRLPTEAEAASLGPGMIVLECRLGEDISQFGTVASSPGASSPGASSPEAPASGSGAASGPEANVAPGKVLTVELALGESALTGLLSWLEAAPPSSHLDVSS
jgi:hypothetical protein